MLRREHYLMIEDQHRQGRYQVDIAAELGVHPKTVRRALARGGPPSGKRPGARGSKLNAYKATVDRMLGREIWNAEHTYESLVRAFARFGGVPAVVVVDNQKAAVVDRAGGSVRFHPRFIELAGHYGSPRGPESDCRTLGSVGPVARPACSRPDRRVASKPARPDGMNRRAAGSISTNAQRPPTILPAPAQRSTLKRSLRCLPARPVSYCCSPARGAAFDPRPS